MGALAQFFGIAESAIWVVSLIFFRVGAAMALLPAFGEQSVPMRIKLVASIGFTLIVAPMIWTEVEAALAARSWLGLIGPEVVAGADHRNTIPSICSGIAAGRGNCRAIHLTFATFRRRVGHRPAASVQHFVCRGRAVSGRAVWFAYPHRRSL